MLHHNKNTSINDKSLSNRSKPLIGVNNSLTYNESIFVNPSSGFQHILLLYNDKNDLNNSVNRFLNEGLRRNQICIHATVSLLDMNYIKNFVVQIENYRKNREQGNFMLLNLLPYYEKVVIGNIKYFDKLACLVLDKASKGRKNESNKDIRMTLDCGSLLVKNGYFEQCISLEGWLHQKPFSGWSLCLYPQYLFEKFPNDVCFSTLFHSHDIVVDANGRRLDKNGKVKS